MLTEEQMAIKRMVAEFARRELADGAFKPETDDAFRARQKKLADQGLLGMTAPVEYGGGGPSYFDAPLPGGEKGQNEPPPPRQTHTNGPGTPPPLRGAGAPPPHAR